MSDRHAEEIAAYSLFPYTSKYRDDPRKTLERMRKYVIAFKYGRGDDGTGRSFAAIVDDLASQGWACPAFDGAPVIVPVPPAEPSRSRHRVEPCWELAQALSRRIPGTRAARLFERTASVAWVENQPAPTLADHLRSLQRTQERIPGPDESIALVLDLVTRGTELLACALALRQHGFRGPISAFIVAQATGKYPQPLQLRSFLSSVITGGPDDTYSARHDEDVWFDPDAEPDLDAH